MCKKGFGLFRSQHRVPSEPFQSGKIYGMLWHMLVCLCDESLVLTFYVFFKLLQTSGSSHLGRKFSRSGVAVLVWGKIFWNVECRVQGVRGTLESWISYSKEGGAGRQLGRLWEHHLGGDLRFLRSVSKENTVFFLRDLKNNEISWTIEDMNGAFSGLDKLRRLWV